MRHIIFYLEPAPGGDQSRQEKPRGRTSLLACLDPRNASELTYFQELAPGPRMTIESGPVGCQGSGTRWAGNIPTVPLGCRMTAIRSASGSPSGRSPSLE